MTATETVIQELVEEIRQRQELVKGLQLHAAGRTMAPVTVALGAALAEEKPRRLPAKAGVPAPRAKWSRKQKPETYDAVRGLAEPFRVADLAQAAGITNKGASSQVYRWFHQGLLAKVSPGCWKRMAKFPKTPGGAATAASGPPASAQPARVFVPGLDAKPVEAQIAEACKARDEARSLGRDRIAQMYQDKVDKLQKELEGI